MYKSRFAAPENGSKREQQRAIHLRRIFAYLQANLLALINQPDSLGNLVW